MYHKLKINKTALYNSPLYQELTADAESVRRLLVI